MLKLNKKQIEKLLPFYTGYTPLELQFALELQYAYKDENPFGKPYEAPVYADNPENPNVLFLGTGWAHLSGNAKYDKSDNDLYDFILSQFDFLPDDHKWISLNLYSSDWVAKLEKLFDGHIKDKPIRHNYRLNKETFSLHTGWRDKIPAGFDMKYYDISSGDFLDKHDKRGFWFPPESKRFGFALLKDDEMISDCISVFFEKEAYDSTTERIVEIGIDTKEAYRRQGFALLTCSAFIDYCLSNDFEPNWGCWHSNLDSQALAKKLGFEEISPRIVLDLVKEKT